MKSNRIGRSLARNNAKLKVKAIRSAVKGTLFITAHPEVGRTGRGGATVTLPSETEAALRRRNHAEG